MTVDYSKGKIYKLTSPHTDKFYIGSTTKSLKERKEGHLVDYIINKPISSSILFKLGDEDVEIELVEECPCTTKKELLKREGYWMKEFAPFLVNKTIHPVF